MQTISPALTDILKARLQAGPSGFGARIEVDLVDVVDTGISCPVSLGSSVTDTSGEDYGDVADPTLTLTVVSESTVVAGVIAANENIPTDTDVTGTGDMSTLYAVNTETGHPALGVLYANNVPAGSFDVTASYTPGFHASTSSAWAVAAAAIPTTAATWTQHKEDSFGILGAKELTFDDPLADNGLVVMTVAIRDQPTGPLSLVPSTGWTLLASRGAVSDWVGIYARCADLTGAGPYGASVGSKSMVLSIVEWPIEGDSTETVVSTLDVPYVKRVSLDKSLQMPADQAELEFANPLRALGWGVGTSPSVFKTNQRCRVYQGYGVPEDYIQTFTGLVDKVLDHRDVLTTTLSCRSMMALLLDQNFSSYAPQTQDEYQATIDSYNHGGAAPTPLDRTMDNGVYLNMEASDVVTDILDRAGWPSGDRAISPTSYVLDEYILSDGWSWAEAIIGDERITGYTGYALWDDELGVIHFAPLPATSFTDPATASYTFRSGEDITALDDETDQYDLITRVKARGPLTNQTLKNTWTEVWRTSKLSKPVGIWYDPGNPSWIHVVDRGTKRMYKVRQSDRKILSSFDVTPIASHPLGLSGDPGDSAYYWLLQAPWIDGGSGGNKVVKVRISDGHAVARFAIPDGRWSALKVSTGALWLTNLDTDKLYKRSKTDGSAINSWHHTYNGATQANPSGLMIDGSDLFIFYANGGTTPRFLQVSTSAPGTVTNIVKTAGTSLHGGEMDTTTHIDCYGDSDSLGLVAKFTLKEVVDHTREIFAEAIDIDLEDELGALAQSQAREHDAHPDDADHPFEIRRLTLNLDAITNLAQATETAQRMLDERGHRRRIVDVGIIGNPALQKTDLIAQVDPAVGMSESALIDTYRSDMVAGGTYLGTLAVIPAQVFDDTPDEDPAPEDDDDIDDDPTPDETDPEDPVGPPPDVDLPDFPDVTDAFGGSTISALHSFIAGLPDGTVDAPTVVGLPVDGDVTGGSADQVHMEGRNNVYIDFRGCRVRRTAQGTTPVLRIDGGGSNIRMQNGSVESAKAAGTYLVMARQYEHGIQVGGITNLHIEGVDRLNLGGDGLYISGGADQWSNNWRDTGANFHNCGRNGVSITDGASNGRIDHADFAEIGLYPVDCEPNGATVDGRAAGTDTLEVDNCTSGTHPFGQHDDPAEPVSGAWFVATGASGGGPAKHINVHDITLSHGYFSALCFDVDAEDWTFDTCSGPDTFIPGVNGWDYAFDLNDIDGLTITNITQDCTPDASAISHSGCTVIDITTGNSF